MIEASPKSLKDSNVSPKMKIMKGVEVCFLIHSISKVRNACWSSEMGTKMSDKWVNYSHGPTQNKQQVGNV